MGGHLLVGIDVSKRTHHVCLVEQHGGQIGRGFLIRNTRASIEQFFEKLDREAKARDLTPLIRLEATGVYSWPLLSTIADSYKVQIYHPTQLKGMREEGIRKTKNDKTDAHTLATTSKQPPKTDFSDETRLQIRELGRYKEKLEAIKETQWKRLMRNVFVKFPGLDDEYTLDTVWMRALLMEFASPEQMLSAGEDELARVITEANSMPGFAKAKAAEVLEFCRGIITTSFVGDVLGLVNKQILRRIDQLETDIEEVEEDIIRRWEDVEAGFEYSKLVGMDRVTAAVIYGELGRPTIYASEDKIVAAAGLDPVSWQSGQSKGRVGRISKQGPPLLRKVLVRKVMGMRQTNPTIMAYYDKKKGEGKAYKLNMTACAKRLVRLIWYTEHVAMRERAKTEQASSS